MRIAIINLQFDCAGVGWDLRNAINEYTEHEAVHIVKDFLPANTETDFKLTKENIGEFQELLSTCDVLHFNQWGWWHNPFEDGAYDYMPCASKNPIVPEFLLKDKKLVFHFHGGAILDNPDWFIEQTKEKNAKMFCCAPPSELILKAKWMPNILDVTKFKQSPTNGFKVFVAHNKSYHHKTSQLFINHLEHMKKTGYSDIEIVTCNGIPKQDTFKVRQTCQITLESIMEGYSGMAGWEALAMGQVCITRLSNYTRERYNNFFSSFNPFEERDCIQEITQTLRFYYENRNSLIKYMNNSYNWMQRDYHPKDMVNRYIKEYEN